MAKSKDLFDDTTMTFGEHLEALRTHLIKALLGLVVCVLGTLYFSDQVIAIMRRPLDRALADYGHEPVDAGEGADVGLAESFRQVFGFGKTAEGADESPPPTVAEQPRAAPSTIVVRLNLQDLVSALHEALPEFPAPGDDMQDRSIAVRATAPQFATITETAKKVDRPIALTVQEAFMMYLKVAIVAGLVVGSPWIFYQVWLFVQAGLYPHERRYVYIYMPMSIGLFLAGVLLCYFVVFPFVLHFLFGFNKMLQVTPQIRLSEWISFAILLPVMFGVSFQLPMIMLFLERISVFEASDYRNKRRMAILVIAVLSMMLTPGEPTSMIAMMIPLVLLYELGIVLCEWGASREPFEAEAAA